MEEVGLENKKINGIYCRYLDEMVNTPVSSVCCVSVFARLPSPTDVLAVT